MVDNPQYQCGSHIETIFHYFFNVHFTINSLIPLTLDISTNTFLYGDRSKFLKTNFDIIDIVDNFIKDTERFN